MSEASERKSTATRSETRRQRSNRPASCPSHNYNGRRSKKFHPREAEDITSIENCAFAPTFGRLRNPSPWSPRHSFPEDNPTGRSSLLLSVPDPFDLSSDRCNHRFGCQGSGDRVIDLLDLWKGSSALATRLLRPLVYFGAMTWLPDAFDQAAQANRSSTALVDEDRTWTFGELADESDAIAAMLRARVAGDTVGILLLNSGKYVTCLLGVWKAGKTPVPLNYLLPPQELAYIIKDSGMSALITSQFFSQAVAAVRPLFGDKGVILMADAPDFAPKASKTAATFRDPALYLYTSGTTGKPKGVVLTHRNLATNVDACQQAGGFDHRDSFLCLLPFFHTYA